MDLFDPITPADEARVEARLVFEVANVTLGLPLAAVSKVLAPRPIRTIPHRSREGILGIVNVDGELRLCASLAELCALGEVDHHSARATSRLVVIGAGQRAWVAPVDLVVGVAEALVGDGGEPQAAFGDPAAGLVRSVFEHEGRRVLLLDSDRLLEELERRIS